MVEFEFGQYDSKAKTFSVKELRDALVDLPDDMLVGALWDDFVWTVQSMEVKDVGGRQAFVLDVSSYSGNAFGIDR